MNFKSFFAELKRRNVYKVAVAYIVVGWALAQGIAQVFPVFDVPNWAIRLIVLLIIIGFPVAIVLSWAFEITPAGPARFCRSVCFSSDATPLEMRCPDTMPVRLGPRRLQRPRKNRSRYCHCLTKAVTRETNIFPMVCRKN